MELKFKELLEKYEVGDEFIILSRPRYWSSHLCDDYPLRVNYPYKGVIKAIEYSGDSNHVAKMVNMVGIKLL